MFLTEELTSQGKIKTMDAMGSAGLIISLIIQKELVL